MPRPAGRAQFDEVVVAQQSKGPRRRPRRPSKGPNRKRARSANRRHRSLRERLPSPRELWEGSRALLRRSLPALAISSSIALALGGGYCGYQWLTHAPRFAISEMDLSGQKQMSQDEIWQLLALGEAANIFRTDMDTLEARLLASPWILEAEVSRSFPRTLEIHIAEQRAVAAVELGGLYLMNARGQLFKRAGAEELEGMAIVTGISREDFLSAPDESQERLRYAHRALERFASNSERPRIGELHLDARHGLSLITFETGVAIHLGQPESGDFDDRFKAFDSAYQTLSGEEHAAARAFRIADRTPSDRVTVAFAGN